MASHARTLVNVNFHFLIPRPLRATISLVVHVFNISTVSSVFGVAYRTSTRFANFYDNSMTRHSHWREDKTICAWNQLGYFKEELLLHFFNYV